MQRGCRLSITLSIGAVSAILAANSAAGAELPRMPDGTPDLQGIWTGGTLTPFERPAQVGTQLPESARAEAQRTATEKFWAAGHKPGEVGRDNDAFIDQDLKILPNGQTSLVVEPADGKVPLRPEAAKRRDFNQSSFDSYETMSQWDRCITREPTTMFPVVYNNAYQIVQTPGYVVIHYEMIHEARIIPIDRGPHLPEHVRLWNGDPRGRWEGTTLVVETTNYNHKGWIATQAAAGRIKGIPQTESLRVVERLTPIDANTINYEATIDDPKTFTRPWTVSIPLHRNPTYRIYEYACHEGNRAVEGILRGARAEEMRK
jgi:hypothetical protein